MEVLVEELIYLFCCIAVFLFGSYSNRFELYFISGAGFLLFSLEHLPDYLAILTMMLAFAAGARGVWALIGSRKNS